ncbi:MULTISPECIES: hypothetical protein [unclassified Acinetobacter]|uniref:phage neck terminator protein n=1 Tax=unclassified Acinetobacter TaxID=196816 RepID=UPI002446BE62|nr:MULTISPECIES: hypothetical protein [unclassified Acinetobacter]MDH0030319.1 hypothetical protein [Acinetobacter sp. GD04021]MDH0885887.1 hypothetical protein [Acinetobacter sp. GD03873]MDH1082507.1 hypothetical protein [Acinetobacter sp. GD03983]MDH2189101.1 hypothetical protein [Acinetobacter sp. GD03645]MDH2202289.1 hypothetical protein [Acinetobacter sp. GD03647]
MSNTSATGGYLSPDGGALPSDEQLEDILQVHVVNLTGLEPSLVRPRWQPTSPKLPEPNITWAAIGVTESNDPDSPYIDDGGNVSNHETFEVLASFYGPQAEAKAKLFKTGLAIPQNNRQLKQHGMTFVRTQPLRTVPELLNQQWLRRYDLSFTMRREKASHYPILPFETPPSIDMG